jgi:hypothetical protein
MFKGRKVTDAITGIKYTGMDHQLIRDTETGRRIPKDTVVLMIVKDGKEFIPEFALVMMNRKDIKII